jgi:hypothetical protein
LRVRNKEVQCSNESLEPELVKGWQAIAEFLGQPVAVVQRWAKQSGMPASRKGRLVVASPEELNQWLGRESGGVPVRVVTESTDLAADLRRGLAYVREHHKGASKKASQSIKRSKHRS